MAEPTVVIAPTTVPREDLGHGEPLLTTAKQVKKTPGLEREGWWRLTVTDTPIPGTYHLRTFIEDALLNPVKVTYNFKNEGRKKPPLVLRNDPVPTDLPQYSPPDFLELLKKQMASYSFKDKPRADPSTLVDKDESLHLCPGQYEILPAPVPKSPARSFVFRSSVQRFPPNYFTPLPLVKATHTSHRREKVHPVIIRRVELEASLPSREMFIMKRFLWFLLTPKFWDSSQHEGPGPGDYELKASPKGSITSCFRSKVPRFLPVSSKTPGPGAYTSSRQFPKQSSTIAKMGREHSLFFNNTIGF
ncbi:protein STPG4 isoform X1 [Mus caroli]|uniref:Protein STPG4 isoform X1 n=1 Tax=Mus caroli TaxID=10089 RepID=A0A6P5P079_MUSCR|nr:protein STPG4 isoform X1 [Mus caroli]